jgi:hypothetical protein
MENSTRRLIWTHRIAAIVVGVATILFLWYFMAWLPWQVDAILAAVAVFAFAYWYERDASPR